MKRLFLYLISLLCLFAAIGFSIAAMINFNVSAYIEGAGEKAWGYLIGFFVSAFAGAISFVIAYITKK